MTSEYVVQQTVDGPEYFLFKAKRHWGIFSLIPAFVAIILCWVVKEPITALIGGIVSGAFLLGKYDIIDSVLIPRLTTTSAASVLVLYLILLLSLIHI